MAKQNGVVCIDGQTVYFKSSERMDEIPDNFIDIIMTSPPYNRGKNYSSDIDEKYNDNMKESEYVEFLKLVWKECYRVASRNCAFFLNVGDSASDQGLSERVVEIARDVGWIMVQDIAWVKSTLGRGHYTPIAVESNKMFTNLWEHVYLLVKDKDSYEISPNDIGIPYTYKPNIARYEKDDDKRDGGNVFHVPYETTSHSKQKGHDAPFPLELAYKCLKSVKNARTVLDPFLGSGTTLAIASFLGLDGHGYEKYPRKDLIKKKILNGKNYEPRKEILIPHYESSIKTLLKLLEGSCFALRKPRSKEERTGLLLLLDTIEKMGIKTSLIDIIKAKCNVNDEIPYFKEEKKVELYKKVSLDSFI